MIARVMELKCFPSHGLQPYISCQTARCWTSTKLLHFEIARLQFPIIDLYKVQETVKEVICLCRTRYYESNTNLENGSQFLLRKGLDGDLCIMTASPEALFNLSFSPFVMD